jgi:hypothetical protein
VQPKRHVEFGGGVVQQLVVAVIRRFEVRADADDTAEEAEFVYRVPQFGHHSGPRGRG